jgi:hypothetical protein
MDYRTAHQNAIAYAGEALLWFGGFIIATIVFACIRHARGRLR